MRILKDDFYGVYGCYPFATREQRNEILNELKRKFGKKFSYSIKDNVIEWWHNGKFDPYFY